MVYLRCFDLPSAVALNAVEGKLERNLEPNTIKNRAWAEERGVVV